MKQRIAQYGWTLHNGRSTSVQFHTTDRSKDAEGDNTFTIIRSTTGRLERPVSRTDMVDILNQLTDEGFSLRFVFGFRVKALCTLTISDDGTQATVIGSVKLFDAHKGFPVSFTVCAGCLEDLKTAVYNHFNQSALSGGGKVKLFNEDGDDLDFGIVATTPASGSCPF
tara:strand:- start:542 stop:1045 length:504 start_codon:yes stop_codon:yes gene_type:complete